MLPLNNSSSLHFLDYGGTLSVKLSIFLNNVIELFHYIVRCQKVKYILLIVCLISLYKYNSCIECRLEIYDEIDWDLNPRLFGIQFLLRFLNNNFFPKYGITLKNCLKIIFLV